MIDPSLLVIARRSKNNMTFNDHNKSVGHCYWLHSMGLYETRYILYWWYANEIYLDGDEVDDLYDIRIAVFAHQKAK